MQQMPELKHCPFCGRNVVLHNSGLQAKGRNAPALVGDFFTTWKVSCSWCGTEKGGDHCRTDYVFADDGTLRTIGDDGRTKAIEEWNRRADP